MQHNFTNYILSLYSMRFISYILATYMLVLALLPCTDGMAISYSDCSSALSSIDYSEHHSEHDHEDLCTPFCVCSCCGSFSIIPGTLVYDSSYDLISTCCIHSYQSNYTFDYSKSVWHPPALS